MASAFPHCVDWAELNPDLLTVISGGLQNTIDVTRIRSVCRSWRSAIPPPRKKLSQSVPSKPPFDFERFSATAVYLLHPLSDPSKPRIVSVQETHNGKLFLRHALTHHTISKSAGALLDLSEYSVTQISIDYGFSTNCNACNQISPTSKIAILQDPESGEINDLVFRMKETDLVYPVQRYEIVDIVNFKGRTYGVDIAAQLYRYDVTDLVVRRIPDHNPHTEKSYETSSLVISDGDLYLIQLRSSDSGCLVGPEVYKVVLMRDDSECRLERVEDLGDRVFFINRYGSFSVSALHLPPPWKRNCVVYSKERYDCCGWCPTNSRIGIYNIGDCYDQCLDSSYSELFYPHNQNTWLQFLEQMVSIGL